MPRSVPAFPGLLPGATGRTAGQDRSEARTGARTGKARTGRAGASLAGGGVGAVCSLPRPGGICYCYNPYTLPTYPEHLEDPADSKETQHQGTQRLPRTLKDSNPSNTAATWLSWTERLRPWSQGYVNNKETFLIMLSLFTLFLLSVKVIVNHWISKHFGNEHMMEKCFEKIILVLKFKYCIFLLLQ